MKPFVYSDSAIFMVSLALIFNFLLADFSSSIVSKGFGRHFDLGFVFTSFTRASGSEVT